MVKITVKFFCPGIIAVMVFLSVSCDTEEKESTGKKPWVGQEVHWMWEGAWSYPRNIILNSDKGDFWWFKFEADANVTYKIGMSSFYGFSEIYNDSAKHSKYSNERAPEYAWVKMTCYKEDGTIIGDIYNYDDEWNIIYSSPKKQLIYARLEFMDYGYITYYWEELE